MEQVNAKTEEAQDFIAGLKVIVRNNWSSQEEFAKGVTSKVNMSNILRGAGGTSYKMREALAARAGMTVQDVIELGRRKLRPKQEIPELVMPINLEDEIENGKTVAEIMATATTLTAQLHTEMSIYAKEVTRLLHIVTTERDKLLALLAQEQSVVNATPVAVKMLNHNRKVIYANKAMTECFQVTVGDVPAEGQVCTCGMCKENDTCVVDIALHKAKTANRIIKHTDDVHYMVAAYPIIDNAWTVSRVVVFITFAEPWFEAFQAIGWTLAKGI